MIDYGIPGDSKKLRQQTFAQMAIVDKKTGYLDGAMDCHLCIPYTRLYELSTESLLWAAVLYGLSYSSTTTMRILHKFPTISSAKEGFEEFWASEKDTLYFAPDKRYLKNNNQVIPAIKSIYKVSNHNLKGYLLPILKKGFDATYTEITKNWSYFGPMGAFLFFDALYDFLPTFYSDPTTFNWKVMGQTVSEGMAHLLCQDEKIEDKSYDYDLYDKKVDFLSYKFNLPKIQIESSLCMFRKLFKGTRYLGYYADRQLEECLLVEKYLDLGIDIWRCRELTIPEAMRGESNDWSGIRKPLTKRFLTTGEL